MRLAWGLAVTTEEVAIVVSGRAHPRDAWWIVREIRESLWPELAVADRRTGRVDAMIRYGVRDFSVHPSRESARHADEQGVRVTIEAESVQLRFARSVLANVRTLLAELPERLPRVRENWRRHEPKPPWGVWITSLSMWMRDPAYEGACDWTGGEVDAVVEASAANSRTMRAIYVARPYATQGSG